MRLFHSSQYLSKYSMSVKYIWHFGILYFLNYEAHLEETGSRMTTHLEFLVVFHMHSPCDVADA